MKRVHFLFYRYRYLLIYILLGINSLLVELIFLKFFPNSSNYLGGDYEQFLHNFIPHPLQKDTRTIHTS